MKKHLIELINNCYQTEDGENIYREVLEIICPIFGGNFHDFLHGARMTHIFVRQISPVASSAKRPLQDVAKVYVYIQNQFMANRYGDESIIYFIRKMLVLEATR